LDAVTGDALIRNSYTLLKGDPSSTRLTLTNAAGTRKEEKKDGVLGII
jgi:hypothetical protein